MELWKITVSYCDVIGERDWERRLSAYLKAHPFDGHGDGFEEPRPERKRSTAHVAVFGRFGAGQMRVAGELAIAGVVGADCDEDRWQPIVESAEAVGTVFVETKPVQVEAVSA